MIDNNLIGKGTILPQAKIPAGITKQQVKIETPADIAAYKDGEDKPQPKTETYITTGEALQTPLSSQKETSKTLNKLSHQSKELTGESVNTQDKQLQESLDGILDKFADNQCWADWSDIGRHDEKIGNPSGGISPGGAGSERMGISIEDRPNPSGGINQE